jgi:hypothetical protein
MAHNAEVFLLFPLDFSLMCKVTTQSNVSSPGILECTSTLTSSHNAALSIGTTRMLNAGLFSLIKCIARKKSLLLGFKIFSSWNGLLRMIRNDQDANTKLRASISLETDDVNCLLTQLQYFTMEKKSPVVAHQVLDVIASYVADCMCSIVTLNATCLSNQSLILC